MPDLASIIALIIALTCLSPFIGTLILIIPFDFYAIFSKNPEEIAQIKNIKSLIKLLVQMGYGPQKVVEIINLYD